jgi:H+/Cl- antiporter ClcA
MKTIKMILGLTLFFTAIIAIMLAPPLIAATLFSQTTFLILLLPSSVLGYILGFSIMAKAIDKDLFENLLN